MASDAVELRPTTPRAEEWRLAELARLRAIETAAREYVARVEADRREWDARWPGYPMPADPRLAALSDALDGGG